MRMAGFCSPPMLTWPTPRDLADLLGELDVGVVVDLGQRQRVGGHRQEQDRRVGRVHLAIGRRRRQIRAAAGRSAALMAAWMSLAAASMLRSRSNCTTTVVVPSPLDEVVCVTPGICANCRSSGWATDEAMVVGAGAGQLRRDLDGREVDRGQRRHRQAAIGDQADEQDADHDQRGADRVPDEGRGDAACAWLDSDLARPLGVSAVRAAPGQRTCTGPPGCTR